MIAIPIALILLAAGLILSDPPLEAKSREMKILPSVEEGRKIYTSTCIRCHNSNPHKPGPIGPDLYSTPKNVFGSKVIQGKYPEGYVPKRKTKIMPKFSNLSGKTDSIYEYIKTIPR